ncbi:MAG: tetratricopeptide repeat protein [Promethearchaeota archaeon]|nr:MAG: tetratricopeptide repeat protein [Candidatus Lokiarchaeota archaeon]
MKKAEEIFDTGKLDEVLKILNDRVQFEELNSQQKDYIQFLKGLILTYQVKPEELIKHGEEIFKEGQNVNNKLQSFDGLYFIIIGLALAEKYEETLPKIDKLEAILKLISNISEDILNQKKVRLYLLKVWINLETNKIDSAEKYLEAVFELEKELGFTWEIVWANILKARIMFQAKRRLNIALEYFEKALSLAKKIRFNHYWISLCHGFFGMIYYSIGELDISLKYYMKSLKIAKGLNSKFWIAALLNNIGNLYCEKGEFDLALEYLEEALNLFEMLSTGSEGCLDSLIYVAREKGDNELVQKYFHRLENSYKHTKNSHAEFIYKYNKALMLKRSSRIRDKVKAEELLREIINKGTLDFVLLNDAYIHLCDLLLSEFRINKDSEVFEELNQYINQLLNIAEKTHSYRFFCEIFILKAKLALLNLELKAARRLLTQAQKIAESYNMKRLAMKISHEHDELLLQLAMWEYLKDSGGSLSERWKLAGLDEQLETMLKKQMKESPKISEEEPVSIFVITEGGSPLISHSFIDQKSFESQIFSGFLTTIDYFIREIFSEGLEQAIFGEYTLLMKSIPPFFITYIFKGDSYYAHQKINYFIDHIQKEEDIWQNLLKSFQLSQPIQLNDIPLLESLISEIFITKSISSRDY